MTAIARRTDPPTSHAAAASVQNISETQHRLLWLLRNGGLTDERLCWEYRIRVEGDRYWPPVSDAGIRSRRSELVALGLVERASREGTTSTGRRCRIWRLTARGEKIARQL